MSTVDGVRAGGNCAPADCVAGNVLDRTARVTPGSDLPMTHFPELEHALRTWVHDAVADLVAGGKLDTRYDLRRWKRDSDGTFRNRERQVQTWDHSDVDAARRLPTWQPIDEAIQSNPRLSVQM